MTERGHGAVVARLAAIAIAVAGVLAGGCASEEHRADVEQARKWKREAMGARLVAAAVASEMADEAGRMTAVRRSRQGMGDDRMQRLVQGKAVLEAIEEAENSFALATRYYEVRQDLDLPPRYKERLDADVAQLTSIAAEVLGKRVPEFAPAPGKPCAPHIAEQVLKDLEKDRAAMRAYRVDIGLITQLAGVGSPGE